MQFWISPCAHPEAWGKYWQLSKDKKNSEKKKKIFISLKKKKKTKKKKVKIQELEKSSKTIEFYRFLQNHVLVYSKVGKKNQEQAHKLAWEMGTVK